MVSNIWIHFSSFCLSNNTRSLPRGCSGTWSMTLNLSWFTECFNSTKCLETGESLFSVRIVLLCLTILFFTSCVVSPTYPSPQGQVRR
ncbi:hypothetical protein GDO78_015678 [Eleutherodactylus coqui]|uniref:Uncharacterized protein n=1 Tax=Eleutherodactylus coqui TaxID=57060 RepID=A0A8J6BBE5_ELECQ|nr:hypothetical protein GDO78_015678 [Eleutherodactylus coqui]